MYGTCTGGSEPGKLSVESWRLSEASAILAGARRKPKFTGGVLFDHADGPERGSSATAVSINQCFHAAKIHGKNSFVKKKVTSSLYVD